MVNLYNVLSLSEDATAEEIEAAYRKLKPNKDNNRIEDKADIAYVFLKNEKLRKSQSRNLKQENITKASINEGNPQISIQKSTQSNSNYDNCMMKLKRVEEYIKKVEQQIFALRQRIDDKFSSEYTSKLNSLKIETKQELTRLNNQRRTEIEHSMKLFNAKQKVIDKYNRLEESIKINFARQIAEYKSMYKGKLLVEYLANLPIQVEIEELLSLKKNLENERNNLLHIFSSNTSSYDQPKTL